MAALTDDEAKLYDRSIRLWGVEAQSRIRSASILLVGVGALNGEVAKNVALAGVQRIGLLDSAALTVADLGTVFTASAEHVGVPRAVAAAEFLRELNPYVRVVVEAGDAVGRADAFWQQYDFVCVSKQPWPVAEAIGAACRRGGVKFYLADCHGYFGFMFADLGPAFHFSKTVELPAADKDAEKLTSRSMEQIACLSLADALARQPARPKRVPPLYWALLVLRNRALHGNSTAITPSNAVAVLSQTVTDRALPSADLVTPDFLVSVARGVGIDVPCVAAVLGGILGQELVRAAAADDTPIQGFLLYDAFAGTANQLE